MYKHHLIVNIPSVYNSKTEGLQFFCYHENQTRKELNKLRSFAIDYIDTYVLESVKGLGFFVKFFRQK